MRYQLIAAALAIGLAGPAFAQSHTLPAGSEDAAQAPIDWNDWQRSGLGRAAPPRGGARLPSIRSSARPTPDRPDNLD